MKKILVCLCLPVLGLFPLVALALPPLTSVNIDTGRSDIKVWGVEATGAARDGSTTADEGIFEVQRATTYQDGKICHNFGTACYCGTTKYWITPSTMSRWKFYVPSNDNTVTCPSGISPTGDADITSGTKERTPRDKIRKSGKSRK